MARSRSRARSASHDRQRDGRDYSRERKRGYGRRDRERINAEDARRLHGLSPFRSDPRCAEAARRSDDKSGELRDVGVSEQGRERKEQVTAMKEMLAFQPVQVSATTAASEDREAATRPRDEILDEKVSKSMEHFGRILALRTEIHDQPLVARVVNKCIDVGFASAQAFGTASKEEFMTAFNAADAATASTGTDAFCVTRMIFACSSGRTKA